MRQYTLKRSPEREESHVGQKDVRMCVVRDGGDGGGVGCSFMLCGLSRVAKVLRGVSLAVVALSARLLQCVLVYGQLSVVT